MSTLTSNFTQFSHHARSMGVNLFNLKLTDIQADFKTHADRSLVEPLVSRFFSDCFVRYENDDDCGENFPRVPHLLVSIKF